MKCLQNKQKIFFISCACAFTLIGCQQTSNADYAHSARVVDAKTDNTYSTQTARVDNYSYSMPQDTSLAMDSDVSLVSEPVTYNTNNSVSPVTNTSYSNATYASTNASVYNRSQTYGSDTQVGVVKPYIPDETDRAAIAKLNAQKVHKDEGASVIVGRPVIVPVANTPDVYRVVKGDTLYSIAFRYGLDFRDLAKKNNIKPPYNITVGQLIRLNIKESKAPVYIVKPGDTLYSVAKANGQSPSFLAGVNDLKEPYTLNVGQRLYLARTDSAPNTIKPVSEKEVPVAGNKTQVSNKKPTQVTPVEQNIPIKVVSGRTRTVGGVTWMWPTQGKVIKQFSLAEQGNKGIDIAGSRGQTISAAADGQVVYAGSALRGYGNLVIINHANEYLSAYAHNDSLLVKEGQRVKRGQQIARMGSTDAESVRLHFEVRYRGQSANPVNYLPK